jgi:hypothetical protein
LILAIHNATTDTLIVYRYTTPDTYVFLGNALIQSVGNNFYVAGIKTDNSTGNGNVCLVKIDTNGDKVWEKFYNQRRLDDARSVIQLTNGNLMLGAVRNDLNQTNERANTWLLEVDTGGNIARQWFDPSDSTYVAEGLKQTQDGGFIYGAQKKVYQVAGSLGFNATVVKMDSNFNKQWTFEGGVLGNYTGVVDIELLPDGGYIACGNYSNKEAWVIKFTEAGDVVWLRKYMGLTDTTATWNILTDIDLLPDGGFVAVGQCQRVINPNNLPPQLGWFLKLDSNGCEIENCILGVEDVKAEKPQINIYPNPANSKINVSYAASEKVEEILILDLQGRQLQTHSAQPTATEIETINLESGMYFLQLRTPKEIIATLKFIIER